MRIEEVAVWNIAGDEIMRHVTQERAFEMRSEEYSPDEPKYVLRHERKYGRDYYSLQLRAEPKVFKSSNSQSPASITMSDTLANLGLAMRDEENHQTSEGHERSARLKIKMWPFIGDTRAVRVCPAT